MAQTHVSIGRVKRDISELVNRVAYGGERIVLTSRGKPKAAIVSIEDYERTLRPALIDSYVRGGFCWVVIGSTQYGRALADSGEVPRAIRYYRALARRGDVVFRSSPYEAGAGPVDFNFDWSFNQYPRAYERPGPNVVVYRLRGCKG